MAHLLAYVLRRVVESMEYCRLHKGLRVYGWVIMENHFHAVVFAPDLTRTIADLKNTLHGAFSNN